MSSTALLEIQGLKKSFKSHWLFRSIPAVKEVSLQVHEGEAFGFIGHNGAGKTSSIKCILNLIRPTAGKIWLQGQEIGPAHLRSSIGYLPEQPYFYDHLSVEETLAFFAALYDIPGKERKGRIAETLKLLSLDERRKTGVRALSKGLQQRLGIAQAILNRPKLLILDEPFSGLDPLGRKELRSLLLSLRQNGTTLFMSSHILSDVEDICDRVGIMVRGTLERTVVLGAENSLLGACFEVRFRFPSRESFALREFLGTQSQCTPEETASGTEYQLRFTEEHEALELVQLIIREQGTLVSYERSRASLEDLFVEVTAAAITRERANAEILQGAQV